MVVFDESFWIVYLLRIIALPIRIPSKSSVLANSLHEFVEAIPYFSGLLIIQVKGIK